MFLSLKTGPVLEPVSLLEVKAHLRLDGDDEDGLLESLIVAARLLVEARTDRALLTQTWLFGLRSLDAYQVLPLRPVRRIVAVRSGEGRELTGWRERRRGEDMLIYWFGGIDAEVEFEAGYGDAADSVPEVLRLAILQLTAFWYENRGNANVMGVRVPRLVEALWQPYRWVKL